MRLLIGLGNNIELLHPAPRVNLPRSPILACPQMCRPRGTSVIRIWVLVEFALETKCFVFPRQLEDVVYLFKSATIDFIQRRMVTASREQHFLCHLIKPARLIP